MPTKNSRTNTDSNSIRSPLHTEARVLPKEVANLSQQKSESEIRRAVRDRYAKLAGQDKAAQIECCTDCGCESSEVRLVPAESAQVSAGCGSPLAYADLKRGQVVVDLGSGGGIDVFRASQIVGPEGMAIGVDSTPEMIWRARETAEKNGYRNVEFRLGEIEHIPLEEGAADWIVSNCVINLAPGKEAVFKDAFRVLKPSGRLVVSDIVSEEPIPVEARADLRSWAACLGGAIEKDEYLKSISKSGFSNLKTLESKKLPTEMTEELSKSAGSGRLALLSITVAAEKT